MRKVPEVCITTTSDSNIKFQEKNSIIHFLNPDRLTYKRVQVDGCALKDGLKCDNLLCSQDEYEERYVELKGADVIHAIDQLRTSIEKLGEFTDNRHAYVVCTKVYPMYKTKIQLAKKEFRDRYKSTLTVSKTPLDIKLY